MPRLPFSQRVRRAGAAQFAVMSLVAVAALGIAACSSGAAPILSNVGGPVSGGSNGGASQPGATAAPARGGSAGQLEGGG